MKEKVTVKALLNPGSLFKFSDTPDWGLNGGKLFGEGSRSHKIKFAVYLDVY